MQRIYIKDLSRHVGKDVVIEGFVNTLRHQGGIKFMLVRDVTAKVQTVVLKQNTDSFVVVGDLSVESVVKITGLVKEEKQAPGGIEIEVKEVEVLSKAEELPIPVVVEKGAEDVDQTHRFDYRWLDLRNPEKLKVFNVWTELERGFRGFYEKEGFTQIYTPSLMNAPSESGAEVFRVKYFEGSAYLAQSPQFYKQMAMASGFEKVFVVGPVFRAEASYTTRHMTEFTGWDFEVSYIESHFDVMSIEEDLLISGFKQVKESLDLDITIPVKPFPKISMSEAKAKLKLVGILSEKEGDLSPEEEREICKLVKEESGSDFVFITDYPIDVRPFYHMRHKDNPGLTKSFDLLYKGVEVTTGAQREHRIEVLESQAKEKGMSLDELKNYINFFRYGCPPHGGVGMGPGRMIMKMLDLSSVKEATFLPRDVKRLTP